MNRLKQFSLLCCLRASICTGLCSCGQNNSLSDVHSVYCEYEQLSESEQEIYNKITDTAEEGKAEVLFTDCSSEEIDLAFRAVTKDHPELFWIGNGYTLKSVTDNGKTNYTLEATAMKSDNLNRQRVDLEKTVGDIVSRASDKTTVYEKILCIHDYIIDHTRYDQAAYEYVSSGKSDKEVVESSTAYGCLVNGKAICSGYSAAFQLLAQRLGFACGRVSGFKSSGESHEWNYILADGDYYFIDVTWDDPVSQNTDVDIKSYEYFCIDQKELELTHIISEGQHVPECKSSDLNYYHHNGLYMDKYSFEDVKNIFEKNGKAGRIELKFGNKSECEKAQTDLINNEKVFELSSEIKEKGTISYSVGDSGLILTIQF